MNWIIDRNMQVSLLVVDDLYGYIPSVQRDIYFGEAPPEFLPYTKSSISTIKKPYMGSTADVRWEIVFVFLSIVFEACMAIFF